MAKRPPLPPLPSPPYRFSEMEPHLAEAANRFSKVYDELYAADAREAGWQLIRLNRPKLSIENLHFFEPEQVLQAFEEVVTQGTRKLALLRNIAALAPLLLTWVALAVATYLYQQELAHDATKQLYLQPFLSLWQDSFGYGGLWKWFTFSNIAAVDFGLLTIVLGLTVLLHWSEANASKHLGDVAHLLDDAVQKLAELVQFSAPTDPRSWAQQAQTVIDAAMKQIKDQNLAAQKVMEATQKAVEDFEQKVQTALDQFSQGATQAFNGTISSNEAMLKQVSEETVKVVKTALTDQRDVLKDQLEPVITRLSSTVGDFQAAGTAMRDASTELSGNVKSYASSAASIDTTLGKLPPAIATLDGSISQLEKTQSAVGGQIAGAARDMTSTATSVDTLAKEITGVMKPELTTLAASVNATGASLQTTSDQFAQTSQKLDQTNIQLAWQVYYLTEATKQLSILLAQMSGGGGGFSDGGGGFGGGGGGGGGGWWDAFLRSLGIRK